MTNITKDTLTPQQARDIKDRYYGTGLIDGDIEALKMYSTGKVFIESFAIDEMLHYVHSHHTKQLDMWFDNGHMLEFLGNSSASPKIVLRSSLFSAIGRGRRKGLSFATVYQDNKYKLTFTGVQLDQADHDILLQAIQTLSIYQNTDSVTKIKGEDGRHEYSRVVVDAKEFQKAVRGRVAKGTFEHIKQSFVRLNGSLTLEEKDAHDESWLNGSIIGKSGYNKDTKQYFYDINFDFIKLFGDGKHQFLNMGVRLGLSKGFSKWLYGFVLTYKGDAKYSAEKLYELSGSRYSRIRDWIKKEMIPAFKELEGKGIIKNVVYPKAGTHLVKWTR
jgi:hypothetical protein